MVVMQGSASDASLRRARPRRDPAARWVQPISSGHLHSRGEPREVSNSRMYEPTFLSYV